MKRLILLAGAALLAACADATSPVKSMGAPESISAVMAESGTVTVTEADVTRASEGAAVTDNWMLYIRPTADVESGDFVIGPNSPPLGVGSFRTVTATSGSKVWLFNYDHVGTPLSSITAISYSTWKAPGVTAVAFPALNIQVDINGGTLNTGEFRTLVFEPYVQPGFVDATDVWQSRDAFSSGAAKWWSTGVTSCPQSAPCTWAGILANYPGATITGGFGINQGSGNPGTDGASDALTIAYGGESITYDFDPYVTASSKESCMNGGWASVKRADGTSFKNQGDCVSYLNTGN